MEQILKEIEILKNKINNLENNILYPDIEILDYKWHTFKFVNIIPENETTSQIQINLKHKGLYTDFTKINSANHKLLLKVVDPLHKGTWETPWMDACNANIPNAMFPINGTRCVYGVFSNTESRVCYIGSQTPSRAIFYIRLGIPIELNITCESIELIPVNKFKQKKIYL